MTSRQQAVQGLYIICFGHAVLFQYKELVGFLAELEIKLYMCCFI